MRGPKPPAVNLSDAERRGLEELVRRHTAPQHLAKRAQVVLWAADGANNAQIGRRVGLDVDSVRMWRGRWLDQATLPLADRSLTDRLRDAPRPGCPSRLTAEQVCQIVALACAAPQETGRPLSHWSGRELAEAVKERGIVDRISPRHIGRLLKRGISSPTASATG